MDTLKSVKHKKWVGGVSIFSGRPDPAWNVKDSVAEKLLRIWSESKAFADRPPSAPPLGYRGCFLRSVTGEEWYAYDGVVTLKTDIGDEFRNDKNRMFEKTLLESSPEGLFPLPHFSNE